jgi:organic hydroperoxide reductase OsmC/OhrA
MAEEHRYRVIAWWTSGRTGLAKSDSAPNALHFTAPPQFGGLEGRWTPEDLLLTAVASCYTSTFRVVADYSGFEYSDLQVEVEGTVHKIDSGYSFNAIVTRPSLSILHEEDSRRALQLLKKTQELCLVTRSLSVSHELDARILVGTVTVNLVNSDKMATRELRLG